MRVPYAMFLHKLVPLLASLAVVSLAACGGAAGVAQSAPAARAGLPAGAQGAAPAPAQAPNGTGAQAPAGTGVKPAAGTTVPEGPRVQRSASVTLQVPNGRFDAVLDDVIAVAEAAGGYISGQDAEATDQGQSLRSGQVTFQVPASSFESVVRDIRRKGTERSVSITGNDVSQQYVDLQARLGNAEAQRNAMLALMQQARSVNDTIQIENQLGQITGQIEQLKGQIDYLDHTTSYATVAVTIREAAVSAASDPWGIQTAAGQAAHNFVGVLAFLVLALGTAAPLLIGGAVLILAGRAAWRRLSPRPPRSSPTTPLPE